MGVEDEGWLMEIEPGYFTGKPKKFSLEEQREIIEKFPWPDDSLQKEFLGEIDQQIAERDNPTSLLSAEKGKRGNLVSNFLNFFRPHA